jgi:guanylate kinase
MSNETGRHCRSVNFTGAHRGLMLILSSPSGAGKTTLTRALLAAEGDHCRLSISATTRPPRPGETEGGHYFFMDRKTFEARRAAGEFMEWAEVWGNFYATPRAPIEAALRKGCDVVFDIDWQGARQLAESAPGDVVRIFLLPPSRQILEERLHRRAADSAEAVARRLAGAAAEMAHWAEYDYVIVNDDLDESLDALRTIIAAERLKRIRRPGLAGFVRSLLGEE